MQVPVHPLVAIEKTEHLAAQAKGNALRSPSEANTVSALAACRVDDRLFEGVKWNRHLEDDPALFELAARGQVWGGPISEWFDHDLVVARARQADQRAARFRIRNAAEVASNDHVARIR